jgi:L-asparaginase II
LLPDPRRTRCPGPVGIAVKVDDGDARGYQPVVVDLLRELGAFGKDGVPVSLQDWHRVPLRNTLGEAVGEASCTVDFGARGRA